MNKFDCRTREKWSPEKAEWCRGQRQEIEPIEMDISPIEPIPIKPVAIDYDVPIKITP
jgi:hypothetical protein